MDQKGIEKDKWAQTGWKIERKYNNRVMTGNWAEERLQFTREPKIANSTSRVDYRPHWDFKPDVFERRSALLRAEGLPYRILFDQNSSLPSHYMETEYEQSYAQKTRRSLPALQPRNLTAQHERIDRPISGLSIKSGPMQSMNCCYEKQQSQLPSLTVYRSAYQNHPLDALCRCRIARAPRALSSHVYVVNNNNKDLNLRERPYLQVPDYCFSRDVTTK